MAPIDLRVVRARPVLSDGQHNSSPAITSLDGTPLLACQTATDHLSNDGVVRVLRPADPERDEWEVVATVRSPMSGSHLRDPSAVTFDGDALVYADAVEDCTADPQEAVPVVVPVEGHAAVGEPRRVTGIPERHRAYDVRAYDGVLYATVRGPEERPSLYASDDGRDWERVTAFPDPGNEVAIDFGADGRLWAMIRDAVGPCPVVCSAEPPYDSFAASREKNVTGRVVPKRLQGPFVKRLSGGLVVIGREYDLYGGGKHNTTTNIWWRPDDSDPVLVRSLPSGGDTSYADWLDVGPGRALVPYYSGHTYRMDLPHEDDHLFEESRAYAEQNSPADIYLAEVAYPASLAVR